MRHLSGNQLRPSPLFPITLKVAFSKRDIDSPEMDNGERLDALEREIGRITTQLLAINTTLQNLTNTFNTTPPTSTQITNSTIGSDVPRTISKLKPASPSDFDRDRGKGRAFLNSCELYLHLSPDRFPDELSKIYWALTYMKTDCAYMFANRTLRYESIMKLPRFHTWAEF